jgi:class 3 adenylate cyclase
MAERGERRLTTILAADVAEYSRQMRADEDGTLAALTACRAIVGSLIADHRGRIAKRIPDPQSGRSAGLGRAAGSPSGRARQRKRRGAVMSWVGAA